MIHCHIKKISKDEIGWYFIRLKKMQPIEIFYRAFQTFLKKTDKYLLYGRNSAGKINEQDEGEIKYAIAISENKLIINFGKPVKWIGFEKKQVIELIDYLSEKVKLIN